jgi:hypothetical protein
MSKDRKETKARGNRKRPAAAGPVWDIPPWCDALGIGRATYYKLKIKPQSIHIGRLCKIIEQPADYAVRVAQAAKTA